ncbi:MAG: porin family protein [Leptospirales bacterium]|nr:porin family protein [Leptospirales bacterium]
MVKKILLITAGFVLCFNANSFALVDAAGWGGLFMGDGAGGDDTRGGQFGFKAHYNTSLTPLFELGVGGYYQFSRIVYDDLKLNYDDLKRQSAGLDVNLIFSLTPIVNPYFRGTWAFWDKMENYPDKFYGYPKVTDTKKFRAFGLGAGLEFTIIPLLRIFGEYMYENTSHYGVTYNFHAFNLGLKLNF